MNNLTPFILYIPEKLGNFIRVSWQEYQKKEAYRKEVLLKHQIELFNCSLTRTLNTFISDDEDLRYWLADRLGIEIIPNSDFFILVINRREIIALIADYWETSEESVKDEILKTTKKRLKPEIESKVFEKWLSMINV